MSQRVLIVNADDFGLSAGVNRGIVEAHDRGIVTSASLMVRPASAMDAADLARSRPGLGVGLHVDLGEWVYRHEQWQALYTVVDPADASGVAAEVDRQLAAFERLVGRPPTHLDSHQHVHRDGPAKDVFARLAERLGLPLRHVTPGVGYCGDFYGQYGRGEPFPQGIAVASLLRVIDSLPIGVTELCCHPGYGEGLDSPYAGERRIELASLSDPAVRQAIGRRGIVLSNFAGIRSAR